MPDGPDRIGQDECRCIAEGAMMDCEVEVGIEKEELYEMTGLGQVGAWTAGT